MRRRAGFTLLETLVALTIVGLAMLVLTAAFAEGLRGQAIARRHVEAVALAEARMGELAALPSDSLRPRRTTREGVFAPPFARYRWRTELARDPRSPRLVAATVVVSWPGGEYTLATQLHRRELAPQSVRRTVRP